VSDDRNILQVPSAAETMWIFTYVPAGENIRVLDDDVDAKHFKKDHDVLQGHVINTRNQFLADMPVSRFLKVTAGFDKPSQLDSIFRVSKDYITVETFKAVRHWVSQRYREERRKSSVSEE
jgi:hypothetical protein